MNFFFLCEENDIKREGKKFVKAPLLTLKGEREREAKKGGFHSLISSNSLQSSVARWHSLILPNWRSGKSSFITKAIESDVTQQK